MLVWPALAPSLTSGWATQRRTDAWAIPKVDRDLRHRQITTTGDRDHVPVELQGVLLRHSDILPERPHPA